MDEDKCPCENCICVAICKMKGYAELVDQCSLITKYLIDPRDINIRPTERLQKLKETINPTFWDYKIDIHKYNGKTYSWVRDDYFQGKGE